MTRFLSRLFSWELTSSEATETDIETNESSEPDPDQPWIGVDLDGTLAHYDRWRGDRHIGKPIPTMLARVHDWRAQGFQVKIFTARASVPELIPPIEKWLKKHGLEGLPITNCKDMNMVELWDDRSVQVIANTGNPVRSLSYMSRPRAPLLEETEAGAFEFPSGPTAAEQAS